MVTGMGTGQQGGFPPRTMNKSASEDDWAKIREYRMSHGLCLYCRQNDHLKCNCPNGQRLLQSGSTAKLATAPTTALTYTPLVPATASAPPPSLAHITAIVEEEPKNTRVA